MKTQDLSIHSVTLEGVDHPVILEYFDSLNAQDYQITAGLFAPDGELYPPFESPVVGPEAIAIYLKTEALGMTVNPRQGLHETLENGCKQYHVTGKVKTPLFSVNVAWQFILNPRSEILSVEVKLLASPQELLSLRR